MAAGEAQADRESSPTSLPGSDGPRSTEIALSVAISAFNEAARLPRSLDQILPYLEDRAAAGKPYEIVVADDGSRDDTPGVVRQYITRYPERIRLVQSQRNQGKGAGVRHAVLASRGQVILFSDADFSTPIAELPKLLTKLEAGYDVAIGSRIQPDGSDMRASQPLYRRLFGILFHRLRDPLIVRGIKDTQNGFKAFRGPVAHELFRDSVLTSIVFDAEVLYLAQRRGYRIAEVPVVWTNAGGSRMHVTVKHAVRVFWDLLRIPWLHRKANRNASRNASTQRAAVGAQQTSEL
jgi:dolichyl-phosphate beta-glucosyltransferase